MFRIRKSIKNLKNLKMINKLLKNEFFYSTLLKRGSTGDRTQIKGVKVPYANHYTIEPIRYINANGIQINYF